MENYKVGYYKPTYEFTRTPDFMAIYDQKDRLIGVTGPATSQKAALDARLFAAAPELLYLLKQCCAFLPQWVLTAEATNSLGLNENMNLSLYTDLLATVNNAQKLLATLEFNVQLVT